MTRKAQPQDVLYACMKLSKTKLKERRDHNCKLDNSKNYWGNSQSLLSDRRQQSIANTCKKTSFIILKISNLDKKKHYCTSIKMKKIIKSNLSSTPEKLCQWAKNYRYFWKTRSKATSRPIPKTWKLLFVQHPNEGHWNGDNSVFKVCIKNSLSYKRKVNPMLTLKMGRILIHRKL